MGTEHFISDLLYRYNCVVVPGFGAFLTRTTSAVINEATHSFSPPSKIVSFNRQLSSNDGLLISYMADVEKMSYENMEKRMASISQNWNARLKAGERLCFPTIGELWQNDEGKTLFQPSYDVNYLTSSFGMSSFISIPVTREALKEEVLELEERIPFIITPETRKEKVLRPYLKYAAVILLAIATGFTGYRLYNENENIQQMARQDAQEQVSRNIQEATFFNSAPLELPALSLNITVNKKDSEVHQIIAGAFRVQENAEKKVLQLKEKGYDASYIGVNEYGLHMVAYGSFNNAQEALEQLRSIKRTESSEAWMRSIK